MKNHIIEMETISSAVWHNLRTKFAIEYTQEELKQAYTSNVPVFVRSNNRNIYGTVFLFDGYYGVSNYYRLKRDGSPVRMYVDLN